MLNKGTTRNNLMMGFLRWLFWLSAMYNFLIRAIHVAGADNILADDISCLHEPSHLRNFFSHLLATHPHASAIPACGHMSAPTYLGFWVSTLYLVCKVPLSISIS